VGTFDEKKRRWKISPYCPFKVALPSCTKKILSDCLPIASTLKKAGVVLAFPVLRYARYVYRKCCKDPSHIENLGIQI
jgi:hypothetical protein